MGTYEDDVAAAFLGQPLFVLVQDVDLDRSDDADGLTIRLISRYKIEDSGDGAYLDGGAVDMDRLLNERDLYKVRDEIVVELRELGDAPVRTGRFGGRVQIERIGGEEEGNRTDDVLSCSVGDEIVATYTDSLHIGGDTPREVVRMVHVVGEIDGRPRATQNVVYDEIVKSRKNLVEAEAYLELGRIFRSMGLLDGARDKCREGLALIDPIIRTLSPIPKTLKEQAFKLKWEMQIVMEDYPGAIATCQMFNRLFPDSPLVDEALLRIGVSFYERGNYTEAVNVFRQILNLATSMAKAEAQFRIAEATEKTSRDPAAAIPIYKVCAEKYPDSAYAGKALAKLIDYYVDTKDYVRANELLEQVFDDYPDAKFLDSMLMKWVIVAYRMRNYDRALEKCTQLVFEYPESEFAKKAKAIQPRIEEKVKKGDSGGAAKATDEG
jgi:TolA-binding protein